MVPAAAVALSLMSLVVRAPWPVVSAGAVADGGKAFAGSMLGVKASVVLDEARGIARIELNGLPLGGRLAGAATFGRGGEEGGDVVVFEPLRSALRRRRVSIVSSEFERVSNTLEIAVRLPFFGVRRMRLEPAT
jgi:hypothetical protein